MSVFESLTLAERARQLGNPEGEVGLAVAQWLNEINKQPNARAVAMLGIKPGDRVLEIGFGNGRRVCDVIRQAEDVQYTGLDLSPTMVEEAVRFNAPLIAAGRGGLHIGSAERMPFADRTFDRVFSTGVIHFWPEPAAALAEVRRVLRPGGAMFMWCLAQRNPPAFAQAEYGFYLREAAEWDALCHAAGFQKVNAETPEFDMIAPDGTPTKRSAIHLTAEA